MFTFYNKDQQGGWNIARAALLIKKIDTLVVDNKDQQGVFKRTKLCESKAESDKKRFVNFLGDIDLDLIHFSSRDSAES